MLWGLSAGLLAAVLFGVAAVAQAGAARRTERLDSLLGFVSHAVRDPVMLAVVAAYLGGFVLHAVSIWLVPLLALARPRWRMALLWQFSEIAVWVAIGGMGRLGGAVIGAVAVNALKFWLSAAMPEAWPFILSGLVLVVVLALPNGLLDFASLRTKPTWLRNGGGR